MAKNSTTTRRQLRPGEKVAIVLGLGAYAYAEMRHRSLRSLLTGRSSR